MMRLFVVFILLATSLLNQASSEERSILDDLFIYPWRIMRRTLFTKQLQENRKNSARVLKSIHKVQEVIPDEIPFPCDVKKGRSPIKPDSVHKLRPGDISVIGAMGDSLTAGTGLSALNILDLMLEERGRSFTIGGEGRWREYLTLPNILKEFNPNLTGYSLGASLTIDKSSRLNVAEIGAISADMPYMAKVLINRIKTDKNIDFREDWKMISIFIGCNDFCSEICYSENPELLLNKHKQDMMTVLRILKNNLPRTIVNIIPPPNLKILVDLKGEPSQCYFTHLLFCPCLFGHFQNRADIFSKLMDRWQLVDVELQSEKEYESEEFAVVVQPFLLNYVFPKVANGDDDYTFLSEDCFHFSQRGDARVANDLWNNLMEPVGYKSMGGKNLFEMFRCPNESHPYIYTKRNS